MRRRSFLFLVAATLPDWGRALVKPGVLEDFSRQYGSQAVRRLNAWRELMDEISGLPLPSRLTRTNAFFNQLAFAEDGEQFGSRDYWATPLEFLGRGRGDCEEFAIAKYVTLVKGGVPLDQLRITYVKALELNQAHMVLTWADKPGDIPLVMDNLIADIKPAKVSCYRSCSSRPTSPIQARHRSPTGGLERVQGSAIGARPASLILPARP